MKTLDSIRMLTALCMITALASFCVTAQSASAVQVTEADIIAVVDESGSMGGEHAWLPGMILDLEAGLQAASVTSNQYGLVGFGTTSHGGGFSQVPHKHAVGGGDYGTAAQFGTAAGGLITSGGFEDGWRGIDFALSNYAFRANAATNIILVTDEDRDNSDGSITFGTVSSLLTSHNALLNAVVNHRFGFGGQNLLGVDAAGLGYIADGSGGFTTVNTGGAWTTISDSGNTRQHYVDLALASGGAAWDLNQLRAGGLTATSFTAAFVDIKVGEIITLPPPTGIPIPATAALLGLGLVGLAVGGARRKKAE